jgi:hypothetical protein
MEKYETESVEAEKMDFRVQCDLFGNFGYEVEVEPQLRFLKMIMNTMGMQMG